MTLFINVPKGQSSPANLQSGQQASNATRQIPQVSSLATQRHCATPSTSITSTTFLSVIYTENQTLLGISIWIIITSNS